MEQETQETIAYSNITKQLNSVKTQLFQITITTQFFMSYIHIKLGVAAFNNTCLLTQLAGKQCLGVWEEGDWLGGGGGGGGGTQLQE